MPEELITLTGVVSRGATRREAVAMLPRPDDRYSSTGTGPVDLEVVSVGKPHRESPDQDWQFEAVYRRLKAESGDAQEGARANQ